jgi:hypothetical protein
VPDISSPSLHGVLSPKLCSAVRSKSSAGILPTPVSVSSDFLTKHE